jgi:hypothetical protein
MWFGWSVIWTFLKFEPVFSAFWDWPKNVFQTEGFGLPLPYHFVRQAKVELRSLTAVVLLRGGSGSRVPHAPAQIADSDRGGVRRYKRRAARNAAA